MIITIWLSENRFGRNVIYNSERYIEERSAMTAIKS